MTLFNVVVGNVVWTWLAMIVKDQAVAQEGLGLNVGRFLRVLYADEGMIGAQDSEYIQNALNVLIGLFWRYGIVANIAKYRTITCQPRTLQSGMSEEAVNRRCTGVGASYCEQLRIRTPDQNAAFN